MRPYWPGSSSTRVVTVAAAPDAVWRSASAVMKDAVEQRMVAREDDHVLAAGERVARLHHGVAGAGGRVLDRDLDVVGGSAARTCSASSPSTTTIRSAPASRAA